MNNVEHLSHTLMQQQMLRLNLNESGEHTPNLYSSNIRALPVKSPNVLCHDYIQNVCGEEMTEKSYSTSTINWQEMCSASRANVSVLNAAQSLSKK